MDSKNFQLQRTAAKFSANIIWLLFYLFAENPCLRGTPGYRGVGNTASSTLRCQHCGVAPPPTWLHEAFAETLKKLPATHKPNKLFLLKFSPSLLQKAGKFLPRFLWKAGGYAQTK